MSVVYSCVLFKKNYEIIMKTSYFSKSGALPKAVSIARSHPKGWHGREFKQLAPPWQLLALYKLNGDEEVFTDSYTKLVLEKLDPLWVYLKLGEDSVLLCWEGPSKFCHRRLVAEWLYNHLNIKVLELK